MIILKNYHLENCPETSKAYSSSHFEVKHANNGPVCIFQTDDDGNPIQLNKDVLAKILLDDKFADKRVAVISVAGAYRKGKSFLLNFFLRHLRCKNNDDWLASEQTLDGFSWRGGSERDTTGILIWSEPFILKDRKGDDVVVLLMDTQGAFDSNTTVKECTTIFALSTMLSSVQIFNLGQNLQENDLQHLQTFVSYAKFAREKELHSRGIAQTDSGESPPIFKPMQSLWFVIRDWSFPYEYDYGLEGGRELLEKRLEVSEGLHSELRQLREELRESFENINCFLMPYPGEKVATSQYFRGQLKDIKPEFQANVRTLIENLLDPNDLVIKSINGQPITCRMLLKCFQEYLHIFRDGKLPEPFSVYQANAMLSNMSAMERAKMFYLNKMEGFGQEGAPYMDGEKLEQRHEKYREKAMEIFREMPKLGGKEMPQQYLEMLETFIQGQYKHFKETNDEKRPAATNLASLATASGLWTIVALAHFPPAAIVAGAIALYPTYKAAQSIMDGSMQKEVEMKAKEGWKWLRKKN
ncbi:atlastin-2 [Ditylenchus destructor]|nr:atlastin-2 [Ditylenchus destructor]